MGVEGSPTLARAAAGQGLAVCLGDAAALPVADSVADCVVCFMVLQDVDFFAEAVAEAARILSAGGRFVWSIVHPVNSAGLFEGPRGSGRRGPGGRRRRS